MVLKIHNDMDARWYHDGDGDGNDECDEDDDDDGDDDEDDDDERWKVMAMSNCP